MNPDRAARVEVLRETVKVAKFDLPAEALPEALLEAPPTATTRSSTIARSNWERNVAAALWVLAAAIVGTLYLVHGG